MPEKQPGNLIGGSLHVKNDSDTLFCSGNRLFKLQHDRCRKISVSDIFSLIIVSHRNHASQIFDQAPVRVIGRRLVEKSSPVRVGVQNDLKGIDDRRFSAAGMSGKEIDPFTERKHFPFNIMPVIQTDLR